MRLLLRFTAWLALAFLAGVIAVNSLPYFDEPFGHGFVIEKGELARDPIYMAVLLTHVAAGITCLGASLLQFFRPLLRRAPWLHRWLGRIYVFSILAVLAPTGFYLAPYAHGGVAGSLGFALLGIATFATTWTGWIEARRGRMRTHARWMVRSFAMASSAITFRLIHASLGIAGVDPYAGYLGALYLSIFGNALVAELLLQKLPHRPARTPQNEHHETHLHPVPAHTPHR